jgi:hypothetical protein
MEKRQSNKIFFRKLMVPLYISFLLIILISCDKNGKCFSSSGTVIRQERPVMPFDSIDLGDDVDLVLTHDSVNKISVEAGQNIISGISTDIVNRQLVIRNSNKCNWMRSYQKPLIVYVSFDHLWKIFYSSAGNISTTNTISLDSIKVEVWGGCGTIDMDLRCMHGYFALNQGTTDYNLHGRCDIVGIYINGMGLFQARNLASRYCTVEHIGTNNCYVNVSVSLYAIIENIGSIYYTGNPGQVNTKISGSGVVEPFGP